MTASPVPRALYGGAFVLFVLYAAIAWLASRSNGLNDVDPEALRGTPYRVTTADDQEHVIAVDSADPAAAITLASEYGNDARVERIDPAEATAILRRQRGNYAWLAGLLVFPFAYLFSATRLQRRERELARVLDALHPTLSDSIAGLVRKTGLSEAELKRQVKRIGKLGLAELQWDDQERRVYDVRLSAHTMTLQTCPHCHEAIHIRMRADLTQVPRCTQCMTTFDRGALAAHVSEVASSSV